jgi:hypothetical protein
VRHFIILVVMLSVSVADAACVFDAQGIGERAGIPDAGAIDAREVDGGVPDAGVPDAGPPAFAVATGAHASAVASLSYALEIPAGERRLLLVSVQLPTSCGDTAPAVTGVTYGGVALGRVTSISGTPCGGNTRSEAWQLVAPPVGAHDVQVSLAAENPSVLSTALAFTGVDPSMPVREVATQSGTGTSASVSVASQVNDLVVSWVGHGGGISMPGAGQDLRFLVNVDSSNTLNNTATSTAVGQAPSTPMSWTFVDADEWQSIVVALRP